MIDFKKDGELFTLSPTQIFSTLEKICLDNIDMCVLNNSHIIICGKYGDYGYFELSITNNSNLKVGTYTHSHFDETFKMKWLESILVTRKFKKLVASILINIKRIEQLQKLKYLTDLESSIKKSNLTL